MFSLFPQHKAATFNQSDYYTSEANVLLKRSSRKPKSSTGSDTKETKLGPQIKPEILQRVLTSKSYRTLNSRG